MQKPFLDLCKSLLSQLKDFKIDGHKVQMIPLHPDMINQKGAPNYFRRAPYPAILFYLKQD